MVAVLQPVVQGKLIPIDRAVVLVGRSSDCDAVITASQKISRRHCCLVQVDNMYYIRDLGSMNGVWVNGERVHRESRISSGDRIAIGDVEFLFHPNVRIEQKKTVTSAPDAGNIEVDKRPLKAEKPKSPEADIPGTQAIAPAAAERTQTPPENKFEDVVLLNSDEVEIVDDGLPELDYGTKDNNDDDLLLFEDVD